MLGAYLKSDGVDNLQGPHLTPAADRNWANGYQVNCPLTLSVLPGASLKGATIYAD